MTKLSDIKEQLYAWFPKEAHKKRGLPGGGQLYFLPHQAITDRLNDVAFDDWSEEYTEPTTTGKITTVMCKLTICGITRVGIADNKTEPELNNEGKEKIIGSVVVNTGRAAFKNAAERFGIGRYLDDQKTNQDLQKYLVGFNKGTQSQTQASAAPKPEKKAIGLYPQHKTIANGVCKFLDVPFSYAKMVLDKIYNGASPDELDPERFNVFLEKIVMEGKKGEYDATMALDVYRGYLQRTNGNVMGALNIWELDKQKVEENVETGEEVNDN